jgi:hypothetical protein
VTTGPVRGALHGENHSPKVNRNWNYTIIVTNAAGQPLTGTADIEFAFGGQVVGHATPATVKVTNGHWHDNLQFPAQSIGIPLTFRVVVHTAPGSITLDWPVTVSR